MTEKIGIGRYEAEAIAAAGPSRRYDRVVRLAQAIFGMPIAALNLIGHEHQYTVSAIGFPTGTIPVDDSICRVTVQHDETVEISDLRQDERFAHIPAVLEPPRIRYYAGVPVRGQSGQNIGALCVIDLVPRRMGKQQLEMLADLGALLEHELAVQEEMDLAGTVQRQMMPSQAPDIAGVEVAGRVQPAREAGGDYYDWFVVNDAADGSRRLEVVLGDVMGKGLAASLIASEVRAVLRGHSRFTNIGCAVTETSRTVSNDLESNNKFSTLWAGQLDPVTGALDYVDAGHGLAMIVSNRGSRRLTQKYLPLGMPVLENWAMATDVLAEDEILIVVSDGFFDTLDDSFEKVDEHLKYVLEPGLTCQQIVDLIVDYAIAHDATDDVTALALRRIDPAAPVNPTETN
ncbi:MAG: SpoIIE family protein phosphatase [Promicromonosporaceae bacterium]|nr:SpoIIE family protein phosphatase [Promicromonosporaceae bacterium]